MSTFLLVLNVSFCLFANLTFNIHGNGFRLLSIYLQGVKMLVIMVLTFALTWLPLHIMMIVEDMDPAIYQTINRNMLWIAFHWLALSNTGTNCIIYFWRNRVFQIRLKQIISNITCEKFQIDEQERSFSFYSRSDTRRDSGRKSFKTM